MSDSTENGKLAIEVAAVLDEFAAAQRALALGEVKKQRITVIRTVSERESQISFETLVDVDATADEIFAVIAPVDAAIDRLKAKADLNRHYRQISAACDRIEGALKKHAEDEIKFTAQNASKNASKRIPVTVGFSAAQTAELANHRINIKGELVFIESEKANIAECRKIIGGVDPFAVLAEQTAARLDGLRGVNVDA